MDADKIKVDKLLESEALREAAKEIIRLQKADKKAYVDAFSQAIETQMSKMLACVMNKNKKLQIVIIFLALAICALIVVLFFILISNNG